MTSTPHPKTPGNARTAQKAVHYLKGQLLDCGIYSFEWPQDLDSGIDVVAFATLRGKSENEDDLATAFIAGFQSKGTEEAYGKDANRSVKTGKHPHYWLNATLPVFVVTVNVSGGETLVEDVGSIRDIYSLGLRHSLELKSIPTEVSLESASTDIRLRMFAHALAPWVSTKLRARPLAHKDPERGLNVQSPWSLLDYIAGPYSSFPIPSSWDEIRQYYALINYMLQDAVFCDQLAEDLRIGISSETIAVLQQSEDFHDEDSDKTVSDCHEIAKQATVAPQIGALRLLMGTLELFTRFPSKAPPKKTFPVTERIVQRLRRQQKPGEIPSYEETLRTAMRNEDFRNPHHALLREDLDASIEIIVNFWVRSATTLNLTVPNLAQKLQKIHRFLPQDTNASMILGAVAEGSDLKTELRRSVVKWARENLIIRHWTDVIDSDHEVPPLHEDSQLSNAKVRSHAEVLEKQKRRD